MSLRDQGHRFCASPDRKEARWLHPNIWKQMYPDWIDVTDFSDDEFVEFFTHKPLPHGQAQCVKAQLDIFEGSP
ncbi:hypothetical protein [Metapseudomonas resinovorans]|uniref:hypothetical protein n=1 Tax=Metapseudomonas resinovorans TaxID=53412 RepID=UPI00055A54BA|nr:hypothetical protein [Pseudomonas resinovorans]